MCNLYKMHKSAAEIARLFGAIEKSQGSNRGEQVYPGYPGLVVAEGAVRQMNWGFPLVMKSKKTGKPLKPKPVNNARTDKLKSFFWRSSFENRRCLIPVTAYAEAEGAKGSKTRTWFSLPDEKVFACAGVWRDSDEWGLSYSMIMTEAADSVAEIHNRMPVILPQNRWSDWAALEPAEAFDLCQPWGGEIAIERTEEPWSR